jgi:hypothetical protein
VAQLAKLGPRFTGTGIQIGTSREAPASLVPSCGHVVSARANKELLARGAVQADRERRRGACCELIADISERADLGLQRARGGKAENIDTEGRLHFMITGILHGPDDLLTGVVELRHKQIGKVCVA